MLARAIAATGFNQFAGNLANLRSLMQYEQAPFHWRRRQGTWSLHKHAAPLAYARVSGHDQRADLERQKEIVAGDVGRLVLTHKDRLLRFGAELVFALCEARNVEVVIINQGADTTFEEDLANDVLEIITAFWRGCTAAAAIGTRS